MPFSPSGQVYEGMMTAPPGWLGPWTVASLACLLALLLRCLPDSLEAPYVLHTR